MCIHSCWMCSCLRDFFSVLDGTQKERCRPELLSVQVDLRRNICRNAPARGSAGVYPSCTWLRPRPPAAIAGRGWSPQAAADLFSLALSASCLSTAPSSEISGKSKKECLQKGTNTGTGYIPRADERETPAQVLLT